MDINKRPVTLATFKQESKLASLSRILVQVISPHLANMCVADLLPLCSLWPISLY